MPLPPIDEPHKYGVRQPAVSVSTTSSDDDGGSHTAPTSGRLPNALPHYSSRKDMKRSGGVTSDSDDDTIVDSGQLSPHSDPDERATISARSLSVKGADALSAEGMSPTEDKLAALERVGSNSAMSASSASSRMLTIPIADHLVIDAGSSTSSDSIEADRAHDGSRSPDKRKARERRTRQHRSPRRRRSPSLQSKEDKAEKYEALKKRKELEASRESRHSQASRRSSRASVSDGTTQPIPYRAPTQPHAHVNFVDERSKNPPMMMPTLAPNRSIIENAFVWTMYHGVVFDEANYFKSWTLHFRSDALENFYQEHLRETCMHTHPRRFFLVLIIYSLFFARDFTSDYERTQLIFIVASRMFTTLLLLVVTVWSMLPEAYARVMFNHHKVIGSAAATSMLFGMAVYTVVVEDYYAIPLSAMLLFWAQSALVYVPFWFAVIQVVGFMAVNMGAGFDFVPAVSLFAALSATVLAGAMLSWELNSSSRAIFLIVSQLRDTDRYPNLHFNQSLKATYYALATSLAEPATAELSHQIASSKSHARIREAMDETTRLPRYVYENTTSDRMDGTFASNRGDEPLSSNDENEQSTPLMSGSTTDNNNATGKSGGSGPASPQPRRVDLGVVAARQMRNMSPSKRHPKAFTDPKPLPIPGMPLNSSGGRGPYSLGVVMNSNNKPREGSDAGSVSSAPPAMPLPSIGGRDSGRSNGSGGMSAAELDDVSSTSESEEVLSRSAQQLGRQGSGPVSPTLRSVDTMKSVVDFFTAPAVNTTFNPAAEPEVQSWFGHFLDSELEADFREWNAHDKWNRLIKLAPILLIAEISFGMQDYLVIEDTGLLRTVLAIRFFCKVPVIVALVGYLMTPSFGGNSLQPALTATALLVGVASMVMTILIPADYPLLVQRIYLAIFMRMLMHTTTSIFIRAVFSIPLTIFLVVLFAVCDIVVRGSATADFIVNILYPTVVTMLGANLSWALERYTRQQFLLIRERALIVSSGTRNMLENSGIGDFGSSQRPRRYQPAP